MILWFKKLPDKALNLSIWKPFISSKWFKRNFMKFVYSLMVILLFLMCNIFMPHYYISLNQNKIVNNLLYLFVILITFLVHELLHIVNISNNGDISITFNKGYFWINTNAQLTKLRFWLFMSTPLIVLSIIPIIISLFVGDKESSILLFIAFTNLIIASSDIINSVLILIKPNNTIFCRGYYYIKTN